MGRLHAAQPLEPGVLNRATWRGYTSDSCPSGIVRLAGRAMRHQQGIREVVT